MFSGLFQLLCWCGVIVTLVCSHVYELVTLEGLLSVFRYFGVILLLNGLAQAHGQDHP